MRLKQYALALVCILLSAWFGSAQDLAQLPDRAAKLWELRKQANKLDALQFIETQARQTYLQWNEPRILDFKITGLEFTEDRNRIEVVSKVHEMLPQIGETDLIVRETWIWKDRKWSMLATAPKNPFGQPAMGDKPANERILLKFEITETTIDLGRHIQGETIEGKIPFAANRNEIRSIGTHQNLTGLVIHQPVWTSSSEGYLPYQWDTALVWQDFNQTVVFDALGVNDARASIDVQFRARIDGKVGFKQVPEIIDTTEAGEVELHIQNLSATTPLKILSVLSYNPAYKVGDDVPESIPPGESGRLLIHYAGQTRPLGASLALVLSEALGQSPVTTVPLHVKLPKEEPRSVTREELERIIKTTPKPVLP